MKEQSSFAARLLSWFDSSGRKDLPWQTDRTPYRVWVSEIMLQQTQVATVIPYYNRFMKRFPDISSLASAHMDEVLHLWSGLGYYSRARNLYKAANMICKEYEGQFPHAFDRILSLPGIGRSTAGAILALSRGERFPILDGNVKRVLCRYHAVQGWPGGVELEKRLWALADEKTPHERLADYTQAIMDLGATICRRSGPLCNDCPFESDCEAHLAGAEKDYPQKRPGKKLPQRSALFLLIRDEEGNLLLEKRPPSGIWGGLWSLPQLTGEDEVHTWCNREGLRIIEKEALHSFRHTFSHFHLQICPMKIRVKNKEFLHVRDGDELQWYSPEEIEKLGLPAPVGKLIKNQLSSSS